MSDEPRPGTTASLDQRVGRLESAQAQMQLTLARLEMSQEHQGKLFDVRFSSIDAAISNQSAVLTAFMGKVETAMTQGAAMAGDPEATPAGRSIMKQLSDLDTGRKENRAAIDSLKGQIQRWSGGIAVLVVVAQIVIPLALKYMRVDG